MLLKISIQYCAVWHYTDKAASLAAELLQQFEPETESITLVPSDGGRFEVEVNGTLVYSKKQTGRHAEKGEVVRLVKNYFESHRKAGRPSTASL